MSELETQRVSASAVNASPKLKAQDPEGASVSVQDGKTSVPTQGHRGGENVLLLEGGSAFLLCQAFT